MPEDNKHMWVEFTYMPVTAEINEETGRLDVFGSDEGEEAASDEKVYGCWFCNTPLNHDTINTECQGSDESKEV